MPSVFCPAKLSVQSNCLFVSYLALYFLPRLIFLNCHLMTAAWGRVHMRKYQSVEAIARSCVLEHVPAHSSVVSQSTFYICFRILRTNRELSCIQWADLREPTSFPKRWTPEKPQRLAAASGFYMLWWCIEKGSLHLFVLLTPSRINPWINQSAHFPNPLNVSQVECWRGEKPTGRDCRPSSRWLPPGASCLVSNISEPFNTQSSCTAFLLPMHKKQSDCVTRNPNRCKVTHLL